MRTNPVVSGDNLRSPPSARGIPLSMAQGKTAFETIPGAPVKTATTAAAAAATSSPAATPAATASTVAPTIFAKFPGP